MVKNPAFFWKLYQAYREKHQKFDEKKLHDWLPLFDKIILSIKSHNPTIQLHSSLTKRFMYDLSLIYNLIKCNFPLRRIPWWHKISDQIYLGALPFQSHVPAFKKIGITSVLSLVENFERDNSFVARPYEF